MIELKRVREEDLELLMRWRMDPNISRYMFTDVQLNMDMQRAWFKKLQENNSEIRWVVHSDGIPIGSLYLTNIDWKNKNAEFGVFIARKEFVSLKSILSMHWNLYEYVFSNTDLNHLYAYNMEGNEAVTRMSIAHGCIVEGRLIQHIYKYGKFHDVNIVGITRDRWEEFKKTVTIEKQYIE